MKFYGKIYTVFSKEVREGTGIYENITKVFTRKGDFIRNSARWTEPNTVNDGISLNGKISVLLDPELECCVGYIKAVEFKNSKWKVKSIDIQKHRVVIELGDLFNGKLG